MDEVLKHFGEAMAGGTGVDNIPVLVVTLALAGALCLMIAYTYRTTHRGLSYSVNYVHSLVLMGVTTAMVMLIIGSNIARAFSLVGALSIVRFRNAVKDTRDIGFLFIAMAIGMACGTLFWRQAILFTLVISAVAWFITRFQIGALTTRELLLTVHLPGDQDWRAVLTDTFYKHLEHHALISMESIRDGKLLELVYNVTLRRGANEDALLTALRAVNGGNRVALVSGRDTADL